MKKQPSKQTATSPETITAEEERVEFAIVPQHPIDTPVAEIDAHIAEFLVNTLEEHKLRASCVGENGSHDVARFAHYSRLHMIMADAIMQLKNHKRTP
jgi:hypothetical protein